MRAGKNIVVSVIKVLFGLLVGGVAAPVVWFILRIAGVIFLLGSAIGLGWLMYLGGPLIGALAGGITMRAIMASLEEEDRLSVVLGAVSGAVGGFFSSIMFFPIVALL